MSLSLLLQRTRVSSLAILLILSGSISSWFLCSHRARSFSILRTNKQTDMLTGWWQTGAGLHDVLTPVNVFRQVLQLVSSHVEPLEHWQSNHTVWHASEDIHGQIQVLQLLQVPQLMSRIPDRPRIRTLVHFRSWFKATPAFLDMSLEQVWANLFRRWFRFLLVPASIYGSVFCVLTLGLEATWDVTWFKGLRWLTHPEHDLYNKGDLAKKIDSITSRGHDCNFVAIGYKTFSLLSSGCPEIWCLPSHRVRKWPIPCLVASSGPGSWPALVSPGSHSSSALQEQTGLCCSSAWALWDESISLRPEQGHQESQHDIRNEKWSWIGIVVRINSRSDLSVWGSQWHHCGTDQELIGSGNWKWSWVFSAVQSGESATPGPDWAGPDSQAMTGWGEGC